MPILNPKDIATEEEKAQVIAEAVIGKAPDSIADIVFVRDFSPLVMMALQKANNPFATHLKGFREMGIEFDEEGNRLTDAAEFAMLMMPKTAEVLVLWSCSREELKRYAVDPRGLGDAAINLMADVTSIDEMTKAMERVSDQMQKFNGVQVVKSPDDTKPESEALKEGAGKAKKQHPTG